MKKIILSLFLITSFAGILKAQETPPAGLKSVNAQFYINLSDSAIWHNKGTAPNGTVYGWERVARYAELITVSGNYKLKSDTVAATGYARNWKVTNLLAGKANVATTLAGYNITDAYTKTASDNRYIQNKYGSTTPQANSKLIATDTIRTQGNINVLPTVSSNVITGLGNSIMYGLYAMPEPLGGWFYYLVGAFHMTPNNMAVGGTVITYPLTTQWAAIPSYNATTNPIILTGYGMNEAITGSGISTSQYRAYYNALVDSLHTIKGYPYAAIKIIGATYSTDISTHPNLEAYAAIDSLVAAQKGTAFVENYHWMKNNGADSLLYVDGVHIAGTNNANKGNLAIAAHIINILSPIVDGNIFASNKIVATTEINSPLYTGVAVSTLSGNFQTLYAKTAHVPIATIDYLAGRTSLRDSLVATPYAVLGHNTRDWFTTYTRGTSSTTAGLWQNDAYTGVSGINYATDGGKLGLWLGNDAYTATDANSYVLLSGGNLNFYQGFVLPNAPSTIGAAYDLLVREQSNGALRKLPSSTFQPTITFGSGTLSALGVSVGTAGSLVVNGGAGGTPSSLVGTNITGTASALNIGGNAATATTATSFSGSLLGDVTGMQGATVVGKINGTSLAVLATGLLKNTTTTGVPSIAVAGTDYAAPNQTMFIGTTSVAINRASATLNLTGIGSIAASAGYTQSGSSANTLTGTLRSNAGIQFNSTSLSSWGSSFVPMIWQEGFIFGWNGAGTPLLYQGVNAYDNSGFKYKNTGGDALLHVIDGQNGRWSWSTATAGIAGNAITYVEKMRLTTAGTLSLYATPATSAGTFSILTRDSGGDIQISTVLPPGTTQSYSSINSMQTTVSGSISGSIVASMPFQGSSYKQVLIYVNSLSGTAAYTFPTAFTIAPTTFQPNGGSAGTTFSVSTSAVTVTSAAGYNGFVTLEGY